MMKKCLFGGLLALTLATTANAAIVPVAASLTAANLPQNVAFGTAFGTTPTTYIEFTSATNLQVKATSQGTLPNMADVIGIKVYTDTNPTMGVADTGLALGSVILSWGQMATFSFVAGTNYVVEFTTNSPLGLVTLEALSAPQAVPVPAAAWLFGSALFGAGALRRKQQA